jgi:serine protease AprX
LSAKVVAGFAAMLAALASAVGGGHTARVTAGKPFAAIVQLRPGVTQDAGRSVLLRAGAHALRDLHIIHGFGAEVTPATAARLESDPAVARLSRNAPVQSTATTLVDTTRLANSYDASVFADKVWSSNGLTGKGIGVAVIDTGIAGDLPDFRVSGTDATSRVVASVGPTSPASWPATATIARRRTRSTASTWASRRTPTSCRSRRPTTRATRPCST